MSEDNRLRPHIIRVLPAVNKRVRAYAERSGMKPNVAAEALINGSSGTIVALDRQLVATRADLESAREATRRADAEIERLTRELAEARHNVKTLRVDRARAEDAAKDAAPCACVLPAELPDGFEAKLNERAHGWKGTLPELRARVITLGFSRYDALATDAAKRAAAKEPR